MKAVYAELHLHSAFSFLDGASMPTELVQAAADLGYQHLALTDHDGVSGSMEFARAARAAGLVPITGAEVTLNDGSHLTLLAESPIGYANLCRLLTAAHGGPEPVDEAGWRLPDAATARTAQNYPRRVPAPPGAQTDPDGWGLPDHLVANDLERPDRRAPRLDPRLLPERAEGLILLTGCREGALSRLIDTERIPDAAAQLRQYQEWFGPNNVYVELQHNLVHGDGHRVQTLATLAQQAGLPVVATGNVHYHTRNRSRLQDVLVAIRHNTTLDGAHRFRRPNAEWALQAPAEMARRFRRYPEAISATLEIAERCAGFDLSHDLRYQFPRYPTAPDETPDDLLSRICHDAMSQRYSPNEREAALIRLHDELNIIATHHLAGFFLLYRDLLEMAREIAAETRGDRPAASLPPGRGRGSSVSSIVCYLIGLSHIDPIRYNLMPGRFINEELSSLPDIDLDFPREIRARLIERVYERHGPNHAAMVCAFPTYRLRSAVRDAGKALGLPAADLDRIAKLSEPRSARELGEELARLPEYASRMHVPPWSHLVEMAGELARFPQHISQHSGGMIVSSTPLTHLTPVLPTAMPGRFICQWDKDSCDDAGFVKIDFLALGMLSMVEECLDLIVDNGKEAVDLSRVDFTDPAVYDMICSGDTVGTFQIESRAQIQTLLRTQPRTLEDLIVQVAIVRPGPIVGGAVNPYINLRERQRQGLPAEPVYDHPLLEPVLKETLGVILYQEQVLGVSMALAGFSAGQADQLRRAMSRKRSLDAMLRLKQQFLDGAVAKDVKLEVAETIFQKLLGFAEYGFPKCHAAAFAVLSYQSSWLKHYYPTEFVCALLNNQPMGFYPPHVLINDAKRHGVRVDPPDFNLSKAACTVQDNLVRVGLGYVANVSPAAAEAMVAERIANGPFRSLADVMRRCPMRIEAAENLVAVGAADGFGLGRREALWQLGLFLPGHAFGVASKIPGKTRGRQLALEMPVDAKAAEVELRPLRAWEQMTNDYAVMGLSPRYHPLGLLRTHLPGALVTTAELETLPDGMLIRIAGLTVCRQRPGTAKGVTFLLLEDEHGMVNVIVFPDLYEAQRHVVRGEPFLLIEGILQHRNNTINLVARSVTPLDQARQAFRSEQLPSGRTYEDAVAAATKPDASAVEIITLDTLSPASHSYR